MTQDLFRSDTYLAECRAPVLAITAQGIMLDKDAMTEALRSAGTLRPGATHTPQ